MPTSLTIEPTDVLALWRDGRLWGLFASERDVLAYTGRERRRFYEVRKVRLCVVYVVMQGDGFPAPNGIRVTYESALQVKQELDADAEERGDHDSLAAIEVWEIQP